VAELRIRLIDNALTSLDHMQALLDKLSNSYSRRWMTVPHTARDPFLTIEADMPTLPEDNHLPDARGIMRGQLEFGDTYVDTDDRFAGFTAWLFVGCEYSDQHGLLAGKFRSTYRQRYS
jgi:hypothetical protein